MSTSPKGQSKKKASKQQSFKCHHCDKVYKQNNTLTRHIRLKHNNQTTGIGTKIEGGKMITPPQEAFCQLFASDHELFGNGVQSYIEAFEIEVVAKPNPKSENYAKQKTYNACRFAAHNLLTKPNILRRINEIFEGRGLNDAFVDKQLEKIITQDAEFNPKIRGIQEYNKLKKRTVETHEHVHAYADIKGMSDEELAAEKKRLEGFFKKE